jgi:hypothetical protein
MRLRITHRVKKPKPVSAFVEDTGRFSHLGQEHIEALQETVDERMAFIEAIGDRIYGKSGKEGKS